MGNWCAQPVRWFLVLFAGVLVFLPLLVISAGCRNDSAGYSIVREVDRIAKPYVFRLWRWQVGSLLEKALLPLKQRSSVENCSELSVVKYFLLSEERQRASHTSGDHNLIDSKAEVIRLEQDRLRPCVEKCLRDQVYDAIVANEIGNPFLRGAWPRVFPPLLFKLDEPPKLLIVSPRERIFLMHRVTLRQDLTLEEREQIEARCDRLGVSSLVEDTGGIATYPAMVSEKGGIKHVIETVIEEWLHQYLTFRPLGFRYLLDIWGIKRDPEIVTINETLVGLVSSELAAVIYRQYYEKHVAPSSTVVGFDFDREMRVTRIKVDELLAAGRVIDAEKYMEERRQLFIKNGYYIRKLNQAYFAFYGNYGQNPASVSPIYNDLKLLRLRSASLADFLERASAVASYSELRALLLN